MWIDRGLTGFRGLLGPDASYGAQDSCWLWVRYGRTTDGHDGVNERLKVGRSSKSYGRRLAVEV
jgi:hypothetical protein